MDNHVLGFVLTATVTYIIIQMLIGRVTSKTRRRRK
jgi:hypothetical protein